MQICLPSKVLDFATQEDIATQKDFAKQEVFATQEVFLPHKRMQFIFIEYYARQWRLRCKGRLWEETEER